MRNDQPRLLRLEEAAEATGRTADELRQWCATGRLNCERLEDDWLVLESELHVAATMGTTRPGRARSGRAVLAIAFRDLEPARHALAEIARTFEGQVQSLAMAPLSLDGRSYSLVAGSFPDDGYAELEAIARTFGGQIVDDVDEGWTGRRPEPQTVGAHARRSN